MFDIITILIIVLLAYLYYKYGRVCSDDLPNAWDSVAGFTQNITLSEADVNNFSQNYAKHSKHFIEARLDKKDEHTKIFYILKDAMNKGKRLVPYKDVPHSPKMYQAFSHLVHNPDQFFSALVSQSNQVSDDQKSFLGNQSNASNLGLQITNDIRPQDRAKYTPAPPASTWIHIERTRGAN